MEYFINAQNITNNFYHLSYSLAYVYAVNNNNNNKIKVSKIFLNECFYLQRMHNTDQKKQYRHF